MAKTTVTTTSSSSQSHTQGWNESQSTHTSTTEKVLNEALLAQLLAGLQQGMDQDEFEITAEQLLLPQKNAQKEAAQHLYETKRLSAEEQLTSLATSLEEAVDAQRRTYAQNSADVQTAALARGMGRSSYTLDLLANTGQRLAQSIRSLTDENARKRENVQKQLALASEQNAQTQNRIDTDYATQLASKVQELREQARKEQNQNYLSAVQAAMGSQTQGESTSEGQSGSDTNSNGSSTSVSVTSSTSSKKPAASKPKADEEDIVDAISGAAPKR